MIDVVALTECLKRIEEAARQAVRLLEGDQPENPKTRVRDYLPVAKAAVETGYSPYTIRQACNCGEIKDCYKQDNGRWKISTDEIDRIRRCGLYVKKANAQLSPDS